jgi:integrase/recombinase XerD
MMMNLNFLLNDYIDSLRIQGYAEGTIAYRVIYLNQFLLFLGSRAISKELVFRYQATLARKKLSSLTVHAKLCALHRFLIWLKDQGYLLYDPSSIIHLPRRQLNLTSKLLNEHEMDLFLSLPDSSTAVGIRDKAVLELFYSTAIRRSELVGLNLYDLNITDRLIRVLGKGHKERMVPVSRIALGWLMRYIEEVRKPQDVREQALFLSLNMHRRLSDYTVGKIIRRYRKMGMFRKKITPHVFRHSCALHMLKNGADIRYIQELLGHASPETTQIYTRLNITDLKEIYSRTHPRAQRKKVELYKNNVIF